MYIDFYGRKSEQKPASGYFERSKHGLWISKNPELPIEALLSIIESIELKFLQSVFDSSSDFWDSLSKFDFNLVHAGLDPEARADRDQFNEFLKSASFDARRLIFYYSVRGYSHAAQNMLNHVVISLGDAYELLSKDNLVDGTPLEAQSHGGEHYRNLSTPACHRIWERFSFCIEKVISFLDFLSKFIAEISKSDGKEISGRLNTSSVTFGEWKKISLAKNTALCEFSDELRLLQVLRDETVHNGTIDHFSRIYEHATDSKVLARFLLFPDHNAGRFLTAVGRRRFFAQDNHLNAVLPKLVHRVLVDTRESLRCIEDRMPTCWHDISDHFARHKDLQLAMNAASEIGAFIKFSPLDP